jgi:hypothetical protein
MKNINIYSYPRSGRTFLYKNLIQYADEDKIKKYHFFDSLFFNKNETNVIILRNPKDAILSMLVMEYQMLTKKNKNTVSNHFQLENNLKFWSDIYKDHMDTYKQNIDNIISFTFEEITNDVNNCINTILTNSEHDLPKKYNIVYPNNGDYNGAFLKTSKVYKEYKNFEKQIDKNYFNSLNLIYEEILNNIKTKKINLTN